MKQIYVIQFRVKFVMYATYHSTLCTKRVYWSLEFRIPDFVWVEWVPNTFPFHNLASELSYFGQVDLCLIFVFIFGQIVTGTKSHVFFWQIVTRTQSLVRFNLSNCIYFYSINDNEAFWSCNFVFYFFFLFFCIKNKWQLHTTYPKREVPFKAPESLFLRAPPEIMQSLTPYISFEVQGCGCSFLATIYTFSFSTFSFQ